MNHGCLILGYANAGYADTLGDLTGKCLVATNDIYALAEKIKFYLEHDQERRQLAVLLNKGFTNFDVALNGKKLLKLYKKDI